METETRSTLGDEIALVKERYDGGETTWTPVSDEFVDNFLGAVPPIYFDGGFACGEEYDWRAGGKTYFCVVDNMARICTIQDAKDFAARRKALPNLNPARVQYLLDYASKHYGSLPFAFPREFELGGGHAYNRIVASEVFQKNGWPKPMPDGTSNASYTDVVCENLGNPELPEVAANIALIASAPDLYAACEALLAAIDLMDCPSHDEYCQITTSARMCNCPAERQMEQINAADVMARAALKRARGEA